MRAPGFALAGSLLFATVTHAQPAGIDAWALVERWAGAIQDHEPGRDDEAVRSVASMTDDEFAAALRHMVFALATAHGAHGTRAFDDQFRRLSGDMTLTPVEAKRLQTFVARIAGPAMKPFLRRAAILHTDITVFHPGALLTSGEGRGQIAADGRMRGSRNRPWHWILARSFLHLVLTEWHDPRTPRLVPDSDPGVRRWYQAVANYLWATRGYTEAVPHIARGLELFPDDAELQFVRGLVHEVLGGPHVQAALDEERWMAVRGPRVAYWRSVKSADDERDEAEDAYRRALRADPDHQEARLHLARLLTLDAKYADAADALAVVLAREERPWQRYFALLFLGRAEEGRGRPLEARQAYEAAAALFPRAQSPRLAISQLDLRAGDRAAAMRVFAFLSRARGMGADPWWEYDDQREPDAEFAWLERARTAFGEPAR